MTRPAHDPNTPPVDNPRRATRPDTGNVSERSAPLRPRRGSAIRAAATRRPVGASGPGRGGRARAARSSPGSVWLCVPATAPTDPTDGIDRVDRGGAGGYPDTARDESPETGAVPMWARRVIEGLSQPGEPVIVRGVSARAGYPGRAGDIRALQRAAHSSGRHILGLPHTSTGASSGVPAPGGPGTAAAGFAGAGGDAPRGIAPFAGPEISGRAAAAASGHGSAGGAALVVVLGGPVRCGARAIVTEPTARQVAQWARALRAGGLLVVLCPPVLGRNAGRRCSRLAQLLNRHGLLGGGLLGGPSAGGRGAGRAFGGGDVVRLGQEAGLIYTQHIVLVHAPAGPDGLLRVPAGQQPRRPHAPCWNTHTDLWLFRASREGADTPAESLTGPLADPLIGAAEVAEFRLTDLGGSAVAGPPAHGPTQDDPIAAVASVVSIHRPPRERSASWRVAQLSSANPDSSSSAGSFDAREVA